MKTKFNTYRIVGLITAMLFMAACTSAPENSRETMEPDFEVIGMANPASVYCQGLGYTEESVERNGGTDSDCIFPDGSRCSTWDFLAGRCGQEYTFCALQGGTIEAGEGNIGTCRFSDGSICEEYQFFSGECAPGDQPEAAAEEAVKSQESETRIEESAQESVEIHDFVEARDSLAAHFMDNYGIEIEEPWIEQNITPEDAVASSTYRYVSGPVTIVLTAEASAPYATLYTIKEASDITNGFYWEGTLAFDGTITESKVLLPGTVLNAEDARNAVLDYLTATYGLGSFGTWDEGIQTPTEQDSVLIVYTAGDWMVDVEFIPAAPLVGEYHVTVANLEAEIRWEGSITLRGEIEEISFDL
ncbi:MAG: DUF333 domain-containing protein [Anaerolineae bacterium]|nr:DUF333 domain-containing protein [Anaerolineae bacterium]